MKKLLYISLVLNLLLVGLLFFVGACRTDYFKRVFARLTGSVYVRERADHDCVVSWNNCLWQLNYEADVIFFGNSITEGGNWQAALHALRVVNMGYVGEDTRGMLRRVEAVASLHPKYVFLMAGINDLHAHSLEEFQQGYTWLVDSMMHAMPEASLYLESILPVSASSDYADNETILSANRYIRQLASDRGLQFVDLYALYAIDGSLPDAMSYDGLHLRESAYEPWYQRIKKILNQ